MRWVADLPETETEQPAAQTAARRRAVWVMATTAVVVLLVDQLTKVWAVARLEGQPPIEVVGTWLQLVFVRNPGAAFSLGGGSTIIVSLLALVIVAVLLLRARNLGSAWWAVALGGMVGGAVGNLVDRIFREPGGLRGHVVDFLALPNWPVFNVADMAVVGSALLMVVLVARGIEIDGSRSTKEAPSA